MFRKINEKIGFFKLKYRIIYPLVIFISLLSAGFYYFFTGHLETLAAVSLKEKAEFVSQIFIDKLGEKTFDWKHKEFDKEVVKKYEVVYFILINNNGLVDKAYNLKTAEKNHYILTSQEEWINNKKIYRAEVPVDIKNSDIVKAYIGLSASDFNKYMLEARKETFFTSLMIFIFSSFIVYIISSLITLPVKKITAGSDQFIRGDLKHKISYVKNSQLGLIAKSLNYLSFNWENANKKIESLDRQLKVIFRDKIGELNLEINQRRLAEHSLKQSEKQFRLLFERAPIGMVISSPDGRILKVNHAFCQSLGYDEEELKNKKASELTYLDDQPNYIKLYKQLLEENLSHIYFENRFIRKDKDIIYTIVESVLVRGEDEKPHHFISQVIDITERKKVERELVKAKEKAEESDFLKTAFLAQMSHEIRTPLNVILAATPILADELPEGNEENDILLDSITNAGKRLQRTIDMILNMSSVQSGNYEPDIEEVYLGNEMKKLVEEFNQLINSKKLELNFSNKVSDSTILADKYTVNQIFQNLIGNAVKYTPEGYVDITLFDKDEYNLCVEIRDSGIGMSREYMEKLFTPFSQEDSGHKRKFEGNGLGLALVKKYVELNNADISVDSVKDQGSVFTVTFKNSLWYKLNSENNLFTKAAL
ncbi:MAG: ATP-binding protein [Ignavibacteriaceae bacterium]